MRIVGILAVFAGAALVLSSAVLAQPLPREFTFDGSGSGGGYTATVSGTGSIDPAGKTVSIQGTVTLTAPDGTLVQQEFGHTADWSARGTFPLTIELQPVEGLSIIVTVMPGDQAEVVVIGP
jgi:type 1 fimbria pilin